VEVGTIGEDGGARFVKARPVKQIAVLAIDARQVGDDLDKSNDVEARGIDDGIDTSAAHPGTGASVERGIGKAAGKSGNEGSGVEVA